ncbi:MAG TPA: hypothetical protein VEA81_12510 [Burkholderiaceae bacterium]|nr:hypothetical protein [Burkholderiaceae bacterium]
MSEFVLPIEKLLATPGLDPLIATAASRLRTTSYATLGRWLSSLEAGQLHELRELRRSAVSLGSASDLKAYGTLVKVLALGEGIFIADETELQSYADRLSEAVTVTTLVRLEFATVDWNGLSIDPERPMPWELTESGRRHVKLQSPPRRLQ